MKKYLLPALVWTLAAVCALGAAQTWSHASDLAQRASATAAMPRPAVKETRLELAEYQALRAKISVYGGVRLAATPQGLQVLATGLSDYAAWRLALDQVLLESPGVRWSVEYLCSGQCTDEEAHKAILSGSHRVFVM